MAQRWFYIDAATAEVSWSPKPREHHGGKQKKEQLIGVLKAAPMVPEKGGKRARAFVLATENTQLVIIAQSVEAKNRWVAGCMAVLNDAAGAKAEVASGVMEDAKTKAEARAMAAEAEAQGKAAKAQAGGAAAEALAATQAVAAEINADARAVAAETEAQAKAAEAQAAANDAQAQADALMQQTGGKGLQVDMRTCVICYDDFTGYNDGVECSGPAEQHFLCNECFDGCVVATANDDFDKQELRHGRVFCPMVKFPKAVPGSCTAPPWDDKLVASKVTAEQFATYQAARDKLTEAVCMYE